MTKVNKQTAINEVNGWLDYKRVSEKKREDLSDQIELLVEGVSDGYLRINSETFEIVHTLSFPIGEGDSIKELTYKPRLTVSEINNRTKGVRNGDADGRVKAYISALCGQGQGVLGNLDSVDFTIPQSIIVFFI
ncbi:MAG: hypothetical protein S4CHLAM20_04170 [Chlamydiia bacterium]|nr:hypothetical protein [Chlamydiia bacterium]